MTLIHTLSAALAITGAGCHAFSTNDISSSALRTISRRSSLVKTSATTESASVGNIHGQSSCFLPLLQNDEEYIAPRTVQIAGAYPGVDIETYLALTSEPAAEMGQWNYDFSDPTGPQMGTVALPGMKSVYETEDPVVLIADHFTLGVQLPPVLTDPVDLVVLCDRSRRHFAERKFLVLELEENPGMITIAAFPAKEELPASAKILGHVTLVQIPWLPSMEKKSSGFLEEDQLYSA